MGSHEKPQASARSGPTPSSVPPTTIASGGSELQPCGKVTVLARSLRTRIANARAGSGGVSHAGSPPCPADPPAPPSPFAPDPPGPLVAGSLEVEPQATRQ